MNRRSIFASIAGFFVWRKVVEAAPKSSPRFLTQAEIDRIIEDCYETRDASDYATGPYKIYRTGVDHIYEAWDAGNA